MKPVTTWIVLANTRDVRVLANSGPGKGLIALPGTHWQADTVDLPRDKAGVGHSIAGHGVAAVDQANPQDAADTQFARDVVHHLQDGLAKDAFDRLVIVAGPRMLGLLRATLDEPLKAALLGEVAKDLTALTVEDVAAHLDDLMVI